MVAEAADGTYDLTATNPSLTSFTELARTASITDTRVDEVAERLLDRAPTYDLEGPPGHPEPDEIRAAGVPYEISERARESESVASDVYLDVYGSERPEVFFKAAPGRTVGNGEAIGVRADSEWNVPAPELDVVLYRGEVVGYTVGNDVGPCVASPATVGDPHELAISMSVARDGETAFEGTTSTERWSRPARNWSPGTAGTTPSRN